MCNVYHRSGILGPDVWSLGRLNFKLLVIDLADVIFFHVTKPLNPSGVVTEVRFVASGML